MWLNKSRLDVAPASRLTSTRWWRIPTSTWSSYAVPNAVHAAQVIAACQAGKCAVLCEKPLAESHAEAEQIRAAAAASGTHVVVGAMHVYDPAYRAAHRAWVEENERSVFTQSAIFLPSNDMFTGQATEPASLFPPNSSGEGVADAVMLRGAITGLAVHNLPLVRDFCPRLGHVETARSSSRSGTWSWSPTTYKPSNCSRTWEAPGRRTGCCEPWAGTVELRARFPPSFVMAGSSKAELVRTDSRRVFEFGTNGYQCEWEMLHDAMTGEAEPFASLDDVVDDIVYALDIADQVDRWLEENA